MSDWVVDKSKTFGEVDADGWAYGPTVDSLIEAFSNGMSKAEMTALSVVRRRHLTRSRICVSFAIRESIEDKMARLVELSASLQAELTGKNSGFLALKDYERDRQPITRSGYFRVNDEIQRYLLAYKDFIERLEVMHEYLVEKSSVDRAYAHRMKKIAARLNHLATNSAAFASPKVSKPEQNEATSISSELMAGITFGKKILFGKDSPAAGDDVDSITGPTYMNPLPPPAGVDCFFGKIGSVHDKISAELMTVPAYLDSELRSEVKKCLDDFLTIFSGSRDEWKSLRDLYRRAEEDAKRAFGSVEICHQYSSSATVSELSRIAAALEAAKAGAGVPSEAELRSAANDSSRRDIWLEVQRYYRSLGKIRHAIIDLSHFAARLRGLYDKLKIRIKSVFMVVTHHLVDAQRQAWLNCTEFLKDVGAEIDSLEPSTEIGFVLSNASSDARLDPTTVEVLLQYYSESPEDPTKGLIQYAELPPVTRSTSPPALIGALLLITTTHAETPEFYQVFGGMSESGNSANTCRATKPTWTLNKFVLTVDGFLHVYPSGGTEPQTIKEAEEQAKTFLENFCIPDDVIFF